MDFFFTKPGERIGRYDIHEKAVSAVDEVVTDATVFGIKFSQDNLDDNRVEVVIDIPDKFYNPDNKKIRIKFDPEELTAENVAKAFGKERSTSLFLNDEWYSRISKQDRERALQGELIHNDASPWEW